MFEELVGRGPLGGVSYQHPVQEALEERRYLRKKESGEELDEKKGSSTLPKAI